MVEDVLFYVVKVRMGQGILKPHPKAIPAGHPLRRDLEIQTAKLHRMVMAHLVKYYPVAEPTKAQRKAMGAEMHRIHQQSKLIDAAVAEIILEEHLKRFPDRVRRRRLILDDIKKNLKQVNDFSFRNSRQWVESRLPGVLRGRGLEGTKKLPK
jgi:hypothetical protein